MIPMIQRILFLLVQKLLSIPFFVADLLSPSFYLKQLRFRVVDCKAMTSPHLAIFVVHQKNDLPFYVKNMVEALIANHVRVVVAVNGEVNADARTYLESHCHRVIYRKNTGRDFGAYQDALSMEILDRYQKVLLVNDSVFYFKKNLEKLIGDTLKSEEDWVALYDNFNEGYHAQSFFLCFGAEVLRSKTFKIFWRGYWPFNLRYRVIHKGELYLSHVLVDAGFHCHVVMNGPDLESRLRGLSPLELSRLKDFLTVSFLKSHPEVLGKEGNLLIQHLVFACESYPPSSHGLYPILGILNDVAVFKRDLTLRRMTSTNEFLQLLQAMKLDASEIRAAVAELSLDTKSRPRKLLDKIKFMFDLV
jgi:hypothetical protein